MQTNELHRSTLSILEDFMNDPRTVNLRNKHYTSIHKAVIVKRGTILAEAHNNYGSRSRGSGYSRSSIHAEKNVVKKMGDISKLRGADLYVMRISRDIKKENSEKFLGSKPCEDCQAFLEKCIREYGLKTVYFTS